MKNPVGRLLRRLRQSAKPAPTKHRSRDNEQTRRAVAELLENAPKEIPSGALDSLHLSHSLEENVDAIYTLFGSGQPDLIVRRFAIGDHTRGAVIFLDTLARADLVADEMIKPLLYDAHRSFKEQVLTLDTVVCAIRERMLSSTDLQNKSNYMKVVERMMEGEVALLLDGAATALLANLVGYDKRAVTEPTTETVVRGPREGFTEDLHTNVSLIRRRIGTPLLRLEMRKIGRWTKTDVTIAYIHGLAGSMLVDEVRRRMDVIDIDGILDTSYIEEFIEDTPFTSFPQVLNTERPDVVAANLLEGRVAILCNGSPFALVVPTTFWSLMIANEDYYQRWDIGTFIRFLRFSLVALVVLLPSVYVAATTFHPEMLPATMLFSIAASREVVPVSTFTEVFMLELTFEALREAGVRLPRPIGQTISIVGALVIGQAAVQAGIVSAPVVIIVAFTGIASFVIPHFNLGVALRIVRFGILFLASTFGLLGVSLGLMYLILHLTTLRSFGLPYLSPISPLRPAELKDALVRLPWWRMFRRPHIPGSEPTWREGFPLKPHPPETGNQGGASRNAPKQS